MLAMTERKYLPTFAELCDRLSIVLLKQIFIPENREAYIAERKLIEHDIDQILQHDDPFGAEEVAALLVLMLTNREIWLNESEARQGNSSQDHLLRYTHSINGVRNRAKNILASATLERIDAKVDCLAADLPKEYGNWNVFDDIGIP